MPEDDQSIKGAPAAANVSISLGELDTIKALTMYNMIEPLEDGSKILVLSGLQADTIAKNPKSLEKMLDVFDVRRPQLVINLLESNGFRDYTKFMSEEQLVARHKYWSVGCQYNAPPFENDEEEQSVESKLDLFMAEVLIPLAARTNAVVLCNAIPQMCYLTASFTRVFAAIRAQWAGDPPFVTIATTADTWGLYNNPNDGSNWRQVCRKSQSWQRLDPTIQSYFASRRQQIEAACTAAGQTYYPPVFNADINLNATCCIVTHEGPDHPGAGTALLKSLVRYLSDQLPSLAFKTGYSPRRELGNKYSCSLEVCADTVQGGTPTVFIDVRRRVALKPEGRDRASLIECAKAEYETWCEKLLEAGRPEIFEACSLAHFHDVLYGDGDAFTTELGGVGTADMQFTSVAVPLHKALDAAAAQVGQHDVNHSSDTEQAYMLADYITDRTFHDGWKVLADLSELEAQNETYKELYRTSIAAMRVHARTLLTSPNFYHLNVHDVAGSHRLINHLVRMDRLPKQNSIEGLKLLRSAWSDYDVAMHFAGRYKNACKFVFILQLLLGWLAVVGSTVSTGFLPEGDPLSNPLGSVIFGLAVAASALVTIDALINAKGRWRQLRSGAHALCSVIWMYRTRIEQFEVGEYARDATLPETALMHALQASRNAMLVGAGLASTELHKRHPPHVYRHCQQGGELPPAKGAEPELIDDHQSPVQPHRYIKLRVEPTRAFYQRRVPAYARRALVLKLSVVALGVAASTLAHLRRNSMLVFVTSASTALSSWIEFSDTQRKLERYTRVIASLTDVLDWWDSLNEVQKASKSTIATLVRTSEGIIAQEQLAWMSTSAKTREVSGDQAGTEDAEIMHETGSTPEGRMAKASASRVARVTPV